MRSSSTCRCPTGKGSVLFAESGWNSSRKFLNALSSYMPFFQSPKCVYIKCVMPPIFFYKIFTLLWTLLVIGLNLGGLCRPPCRPPYPPPCQHPCPPPRWTPIPPPCPPPCQPSYWPPCPPPGKVGHHVGHLVHLHGGYHNVISKLCEGSETLTESKSESITNRRTGIVARDFS